MTLPRIMAILEDHISVAVPVGTEYANIRGLDTAAEKIMEAVGGGWNEACDKISEACLQRRDQIADSHDPRDAGRRYGFEASASVARHLRRPDAAPGRERPSMEDVARAICPWAFDPDCGEITSVCEAHRKDAMQKAERVLALLEGK